MCADVSFCACVPQVRHNEDALTQLIDDGGAIPALSDLLAESHPEAVQEQVAQLLGLITSRFADARETAVKVCAGCHLSLTGTLTLTHTTHVHLHLHL